MLNEGNEYLRSGSCDRFAARPSASANLTPSAQANLAQTTWNGLGHAARSVGISLGPGLVDFVDGPSLSAEPPDLAAKQGVDWSMMRMANEERIRVGASPVAARRQVRGDAESHSSFAMSKQSI